MDVTALLINLIWQDIRVLGAEIVNIEGSGSMAIDKLDRLTLDSDLSLI